MPEYEYKCKECGHAFSVRKRIAEASREEPCPACGRETRRVWSALTIAGSACAPASGGGGGG